MTRLTKRGAALVASGALIGGAISVAVTTASAEAIPAPQQKCTFATKTITVADGWQPLGLAVTVKNGQVARNVVTHLSADVGVAEQAEVRVGYKIDSGPIREKYYGPGNFANHTDFWQTRNAMAVMSVPAGAHTITPYVRISGSEGKAGWFENGCFVAEARTK